MDQSFSREVQQFMFPMFDMQPVTRFYNDGGSPNAFATPDNLLGGNQGTVGFGLNLLSDLFQRFANTGGGSIGDHAAAAILAHEFGHQAQFRVGLPWSSGRNPELHADFIAGWYMGARAMQMAGMATVNIAEAAQQMFNVGDFAFNDRNHHGTPQQRYALFVMGVNATAQGQIRNAAEAYHLGVQIVGSM